ncbi:MAG: hypothetical protein V8Q36_04590 [Anaerotignum sp.]
MTKHIIFDLDGIPFNSMPRRRNTKENAIWKATTFHSQPAFRDEKTDIATDGRIFLSGIGGNTDCTGNL